DKLEITSAGDASFAGAGGLTADFTLSVARTSQSVVQGGSTTYTVTITPANGFTGTVNLTSAGFGSGARGNFNPTTIPGSGRATLTVTTLAGAQTGTFNLTITGASGTLRHSQTVTLTVNAAGARSSILLVQSAAAQGSAVMSLSKTFAAGNTAGNL